MVELKCRICGGNLKIVNKRSYATCESCGSTMTLPNMNEDRIINLFNRASHYCLQNEFDKALATYENILAEDNSNAEAHWGVVLAKYGIEYVEEPNTHKRVPTCHRVQYESILADLDYKEAISNAQDDNARILYEKEAKQIAEIQKNILAVASNEEPYDIFISYKEKDSQGQRTKDSVFAQDIYNKLVQENYKVFFSRISLEDKLGTQYEPYIFSALNSAKVMLVVGTAKENFDAVWVKNEWSRFLELLKKDSNRVIIPCYRDMDAYDLPEELSLFQSQDMGKIGFMQDLIYGISKIIRQTRKENTVNTIKVIDNNDSQTKFENLLLKARKAVDEKNWEYVEKYYNLLAEEFPKKILIEGTFFAAAAKVMKKLVNIKLNEYKEVVNYFGLLTDSFSVIEKYYDISMENKEEVLKKISNFLIEAEVKVTYPYNQQFYEVMIAFTNELEKLASTHEEIYLDELLQKHKQIEEQDENSKKVKKSFGTAFYIIWFIWILLTASIMEDSYDSVLTIVLSVFAIGVFPGLCIMGFIKSFKIIVESVKVKK